MPFFESQFSHLQSGNKVYLAGFIGLVITPFIRSARTKPTLEGDGELLQGPSSHRTHSLEGRFPSIRAKARLAPDYSVLCKPLRTGSYNNG